MEKFKVGDELILDIIDINSEGMAVGKYEGFTFFIEGGTIGDKVSIEILEKRKNIGIGRVKKILEYSSYRIESKCMYFPECDGCQLHNLNYKKQLQFKKDMVENAIKRIGKITDIVIEDTIGMEYPYRYRNKAEFKLGRDYNIGYYKRGTHDLISIDKCIIQNKVVDEIINVLKDYMKKYKVEGYDNKSKKGIIKNIVIRTSKDNESMIIIVTKGKVLPYKEELIKLLTGICGRKIVSIYQNINGKDNSLIFGEKNIKLYGEDKIIDYLGEYRFLISPKSFFQVNHIQTEVLYDKVVEYLDLKGNETVVDLYCGIGTISIYISKFAKKVYGVEIVKEAIEDANHNLKLNNINNVEFILGKSEDVLPKLNNQGIKIDALVVDPPRKGLDRTLLNSIAKANPKKIAYVSCNPATLARDLAYLEENGYKAKVAQPVDMFGMTVHVECVIKIQRVK